MASTVSKGSHDDVPQKDAHLKADVTDVDQGTVEAFGYTQTYRRIFRTTGNIALTLAISSPLGAILVISSYQSYYAGYWGFSWGWIIPSILFFPQAMAVAELASSMPVNGAFYWWVGALAPPKYARALSFSTGIANMLQLLTSIASFSYACGYSLATLITFAHPEWVPKNPQTMAMAIGIVLIWSSLALTKMEGVAWVFIVSCGIVLLMTAIFVIALPVSHAVLGLPFASAADVFGNYHNSSDWDNSVAVPMSFFSVAWVVTGWASPAYITEETHNPRQATPRAILLSFGITAGLGVVVCLILGFCITDMETVALDPGLPMYTLLFAHWGFRPCMAFFLVGSINTFFGGSSLLVTSSSQIAAFARDGGLPFSKTLQYINPRTNVPIYSVMTLAGGAFLFLLLALSPVASTIIYNLAVICGLILFGLPISLRLIYPARFIQGPFNYGKWSYAVHAYALLSLVWLIIMESFPASKTWDATTFNYSWVVSLGAFALGGIWYFIYSGDYKPVSLEQLETWHAESSVPRVSADEAGASSHQKSSWT